MNPPTQPSATPRTDAVCIPITEPVTPDYCQLEMHARTLETELAAAKAECERLAADWHRMKKESQGDMAHCHSMAKGADAEIARLRAEVEKLTIADHAWRTAAKFDAHNAEVLQTEIERLKEGRPVVSASLYDETLVRADRAEAEVERLKKRIKDDNRSYGCELRDPNGTIWEQAAKDHARAEKAEAENERLKELGDKWAIDARNEAERAERAEVESAGRLKVLEEKAEELRAEWLRAERAEAALALLKPKFEKHCAEHNDRLRDLRYAENMQRKAEAEALAQAALLGRSAEREADLLGKLSRAEHALCVAKCPHIVSTNEGTHYCALAESTVAEARKDSQRFNLLATLLEDVYIGDIDPTKHRTEDNEWPDAWRDAIDAAMTNSNHKTT